MNILSEKEARTRMIAYIDYLVSNPKIDIRQTLNRYKVKLSFGDDLNEKEFNTLWAFIKRDTNKDKKTVIAEYKYILETETYPTTLEQFF